MGGFDMNAMFIHASSLNQNISCCDVSSVTNMNTIVRERIFIQELSSCEVSSVKSMNGMFKEASSFTDDLSPWNVLSLTKNNMNTIFYQAPDFNPDKSS
ncbi:unnamed protein product [Cylindrotheca closterium]|uniref:BspA family leucine-rich repeat surface protein n=1 Tax=Cylindrotheca closterium TaxID=2856 RepID=A0AAD2JNX5_9STRA|nr:unnamed protein product [Cylindrotheca closterium]